jgi:hypothetical protein
MTARALAASLGLLVLVLAVSMYGAATTPGNHNFKTKWADWLRSHHAAFVVNPLEQWYDNSQAPAKGGAPRALTRIQAASRHPASPDPTKASGWTIDLPDPTPIPLGVSLALTG